MISTSQLCIVLSTGALALSLVYIVKRWSFSRPDQSKDSQNSTSKKKRKNTGFVNYDTLSTSVNTFNPQLTVVLKYLVEKSAYKDHQIGMSESGCLINVSDVLQTTSNPDIKILCLKILMNVSTDPSFLDEFILPITSYLCEALTEDNEDILPDILKLLVNITSHDDAITGPVVSHDNVFVAYSDLHVIPQILSRYTQQINYHYEIVLNCLKILINFTCTNVTFELNLVYMSIIHLLFGCKNNAVLLRVLTLLRNIIDSKSLKHDRTFDAELMRGVATVLTSNQDQECIDIANQIYRIISDH